MQYVFDDGASGGEAKYVRLAALIYPDGQILEYGGPRSPSAVSRIESIAFSGLTNAVYHYLGLGTVVGRDTPVVAGGLSITYGTGTSGTSGTASWPE